MLGLLLGVWGVILIATVDNKPEQKARNFKKDVEKGTSLLITKRSSPPKTVGSVAEGGGEEQPKPGYRP